MSNLEIATQYANDVLADIIPACSYVKLAAKRFLKDLSDERYFYDENGVATVVKFINHLNLSEQAVVKKFKLENWQTFIISNIYGIKRNDNGLRKYRYAYIEMSRKNGKSELATALALYHLLTDNEAQVVLSANSREQIKLVDFRKVKNFAAQLDPNQKHLVHYFNSIKFGKSELFVTAADSKRLDGLSTSFAIIDEYHSAPDNRLYNVIKSSMGARVEPLFCVITTAGFDTESACYNLRSYVIDVLNEMIEDEAQFGIVYTLDENDDYADKSTWIKANPNLNVSIQQDFLHSEVNKAVQNEAERAGVLVKNFNRWLRNNTTEVWIPEEYINKAMQKISINDFRDEECIIGVDLASVSDVTAVSYLFYRDDIIYFFNRYYIPEDSVSTVTNREMYKEAAALGYLNITQGNVTDYDVILEDILKQNDVTPIQKIYYDKWNSTQFIIDVTNAGLNSTPFSQTAGNVNKPIREFERLIKSERIVIEHNTITKWMLMNVITKTNWMGNISLDKSTNSKKIDGVSAMINAMGGMLTNPVLGTAVW